MSNASPIRPSWKQGFARNAAESANPGLWQGLAGLWVPALGVTGVSLFDVSGRHRHAVENGGVTWQSTRLGWASFLTLNDYWSFSDIALGKRYTLMSVITRTTLRSNWLLRASGATNEGMLLLDDPSRIYHYMSDGSNDNINVAIPIGEPFAAGITRTTDTAIRYYVNGSDIGGDTCVDLPMTVARLGHSLGGLAQHNIHTAGCWKRPLSASEMAQIHGDFFAPLRLSARVSVATAAAPSVGMLNRFGSMKGGISGGRYGIPMTGGMSG